MAYLKDIRQVCLARCGRYAQVELVNNQEVSQGFFCRTCGERKESELSLREHQVRKVALGITTPGLGRSWEAPR